MNAIINEIYKDYCTITGNENISFTLAIKADELLRQLDYYPSYIWNSEGKIIFEYNQKAYGKSLFIEVTEQNVSGKVCGGKHII